MNGFEPWSTFPGCALCSFYEHDGRLGLTYVFGDSKWAPDRTHRWIAKKQLFNSGFVKLVKRKMALFKTFKWLIWTKLFRYWTLNVKNFTPRNIAYILIAE